MGPVLEPFRSRTEALGAEREWLNDIHSLRPLIEGRHIGLRLCELQCRSRQLCRNYGCTCVSLLLNPMQLSRTLQQIRLKLLSPMCDLSANTV